MTVQVTRARWGDVPAMVRLVEQHRMALAQYAPRFWRRAAGAARWTRGHFRLLLIARSARMLVATDQGVVVGFVVARRAAVPPVYAPGGKAFLIDDFCVADPGLWPSVGTALLDAVRRVSEADAQFIVVAPVGDEAKTRWLASRACNPSRPGGRIRSRASLVLAPVVA